MVDPPKPGAALPYPWKLAVVPLRVAILAAVALRLRSSPIDVVHVHYASQGILGLLSGHPYVIHCHGTDIRGATPTSAWGRGLAPMISRADVVLYSTPDLAGSVLRFRPDAMFLPNPIDTGRFYPATQPTRDVLVGVRLDPVKGADIAIAAIRKLLRRRSGTTVTVISDGPEAHRLLRGLDPTVTVMPPVSHRDMPDLLRSHRIAVGQFHLGILGVYELEAMACGVPVVADFRYDSAYPEPAPVIHASTAEDASEVIAVILDNPVELARLGTESREWVLRHHASTRVVEQLLQVYRAMDPATA